ncbi:MAG: oligosaccharide flippase family protein [Lachnospiraceae bacterium]|nr:oligosaccharide flippase family protein [Lachnospiraceae bacterium]
MTHPVHKAGRLLKNNMIAGTLLLTCAGLITRIIGFFYRIFLSNALGARLLGIYQLIFPVYGICFTIFASGIQTAISKEVAEKQATRDERGTGCFLLTGTLLSVALALLLSALLFFSCRLTADLLLHEPECAESLRLLSVAFPFCGITSCISGYYYGKKRSFVPATSQLAEQTVRVVFLLLVSASVPVTCELAIVALLAGELFSCVYSCLGLLIMRRRERRRALPAGIRTGTLGTAHSGRSANAGMVHNSRGANAGMVHGDRSANAGTAHNGRSANAGTAAQAATALTAGRSGGWRSDLKRLLKRSVPLTTNRLFINVLHSFEAFLVPLTLRRYGMSRDEALSIFGILSGMTMSFLMFPGTLTNSLSVLLLPAVSEASARDNRRGLARSISVSIKYSVLLGVFAGFAFFFFGEELGVVVFHEEKAGVYLACLSFLCPILYVSTTLSSILNGLDKMNLTFLSSVLGLTLRVILFGALIPRLSVYGYFVSLLVSQLFMTLFDLILIRRSVAFSFDAVNTIVKPSVILLAAASFFFRVYEFLASQTALPHLLLLGVCGTVMTLCALGLFAATGIFRRNEPGAGD